MAIDQPTPSAPHLCECGCGQPTNLSPKTSTREGYVKGRPYRFLHTHAQRRPLVAYGPALCQCGCGQVTNFVTKTETRRGTQRGQPRRFVAGHQSRKQHVTGPYRQSHDRRRLHVVLAERALGHQLPPRAQVHHVDGDGLNNTPTNLVICEDAAYHGLLHRRTRVVKAGGNPNTEWWCSCCRRLRPLDAFSPRTGRRAGYSAYCRACAAAARRSRW